MYKYIPVLLFILYLVGMTALMIWQGIGLAPDRYFAVLILGSLLVKRTRQFLLDWLPFLFILLTYDFLRGFADTLGSRVRYHELISADLFLFNGTLPVNYLQDMFYKPGSLQWYDFFLTVVYFLHFVLPLGFGYLLWLKNRSKFREFTIALLILSYAAWITYVAYPAAPPWLAQEKGYIHGITKIMSNTFRAFPEKISLPTIYYKFNPNPVAAMPSMHAAYPFLVLLFCVSYFKWKGLFFLPYALTVWIALIYLGEHYVIDELVGILYAIIIFFLTKAIFAHKDNIKNGIQKLVKQVKLAIASKANI